ncbi:MAG: hypothetical protein WC052_04555 [Patescibacteria group bacterium]
MAELIGGAASRAATTGDIRSEVAEATKQIADLVEDRIGDLPASAEQTRLDCENEMEQLVQAAQGYQGRFVELMETMAQENRKAEQMVNASFPGPKNR